ncbi:CRISPR-associated protein Cas2 [Mesorhizobium amorphae]|uniref:CRISPR-associated protein Cas2 n=1 Tax=Mesorhizobium amorphae TaxID=71433 RepID=UPI00178224F5|nr:CRISPR-associated protein Cas2 [Mesorhizobium amorphae]
MTSYTVNYDLRNEDNSFDYEVLWDELKRLNGHKTQYSMWLVAVNNTAKELHDHLKSFVDSNDRILVSEITKNNYYSNAIGGTNGWLASNPPGR